MIKEIHEQIYYRAYFIFYMNSIMYDFNNDLIISYTYLLYKLYNPWFDRHGHKQTKKQTELKIWAYTSPPQIIEENRISLAVIKAKNIVESHKCKSVTCKFADKTTLSFKPLSPASPINSIIVNNAIKHIIVKIACKII